MIILCYLILFSFLEQKYASFTRQLNIYGFRFTKSGSYFHPYFQRGRKELLCQVIRVPVKSLSTTKRSKSKKINVFNSANQRSTLFDCNIPMSIVPDSVPDSLQYPFHPPFFSTPLPVPWHSVYGQVSPFPPLQQYTQYLFPSHSTTIPPSLTSSPNDYHFHYGDFPQVSETISLPLASPPSFDISSSSFSPENDTDQFFKNVQEILFSPSFDDGELP